MTQNIEPSIGDITTRDKVGLAGRSRIIWNACPECGHERWSSYSLYKKRDGKILCAPCIGRRTINQNNLRWWNESEHRDDCQCSRCADQWGENNPSWNGGKYTTADGYVNILVAPDSPYIEMADSKRYVAEHRLKMAQKLGRPLRKGETVHHIDGNRGNNDLGNLELWYTNHGHGVRVKDMLEDWARLYDYHCPGCECKECYDG